MRKIQMDMIRCCMRTVSVSVGLSVFVFNGFCSFV